MKGGSTLLTGGRVYDVHQGAYRDVEIVIEGERIAELLPRGASRKTDKTIDFNGRYLLPGLIDCHVHLVMATEAGDPSAGAKRTDAEVALYAAKAAERTLLCGITTARDCGGWNYVEMAVRDAIESGLMIGPRLYLCGKLLSIPTGAVEYYPGMYEVVSGPEQVKEAARKQLANGADFIKTMATGAILSPKNENAGAIQLGLAELKAAVEIAEDNFKHVAAHAHALRGIENAVEAGCRSVEHGSYIDDKTAAKMRDRGVFLVPTLCTFFKVKSDASMVERIPPHLRERLQSKYEMAVVNRRRAHAIGTPIAMGTDAGTPGNHHGENTLECVAMVRDLGLTPVESIFASTINPAKLLGESDNLGALEIGKYADIIAFDADPVADIDVITKVKMVMKGGTIYRDDKAARV